MAGDFETWLRSAASDGERPAEPAATVVLVRDGVGERGLEVLMVRKTSKIAFGGMWVFPGGRIDDADREGAADDLDAARRAAVREADEEVDLKIPPDSLVPFSFWLPPPQTPRRFATWFFLAPAPAGDVVVDMGEILEHRWVGPAEALEMRDAGEVELAPPTWVSLWTLAQHADVASVLAEVRSAPPQRFETAIADVDGDLAALWHGDCLYEAAPGPSDESRHRLVMCDGPWRYERTE